MLTIEIKKAINDSVLCWLATSSADNIPNVSPKEIFTYFGDSLILVANIASPQTVRNIKENEQVCISFIDVFVQKGFQVKGSASIIKKTDSEFQELSRPLLEITKGEYPFSSLTMIKVGSVKPVIAPSYKLFPEKPDEQRLKQTYQNYGVEPL